MTAAIGSAARLRLELFVDDLAGSLDFYTRVLGFTVRQQKAEGYAALARGDALIALNTRSSLSSDHPIRPAPDEGVGKGVEIVLVVEDIDAVHAHVLAPGWPISGALSRRPWGASDFRVVDPDGDYVRITA